METDARNFYKKWFLFLRLYENRLSTQSFLYWISGNKNNIFAEEHGVIVGRIKEKTPIKFVNFHKNVLHKYACRCILIFDILRRDQSCL